MFKTNVGSLDRTLRLILAVVLIVAWFMAPGLGWRWVLLVLAAVMALTGAISSCPLYSLLGISTCPLKKA